MEDKKSSPETLDATELTSNARLDIGSRIPTEILYEIIEYFMPIPKEGISFMTVCRQWRFIVVDSPKFWTRISLNPWNKDDIAHNSFNDALDRIKWLLGRAGQLPLQVLWNPKRIDLLEDQHVKLDEEIQHFFLARAPSERWESLMIASGSIQKVHSFSHCVFTSLRRLIFSANLPSEMISLICKTAPALLKLSIFTVGRASTALAAPLVNPETELRLFQVRGEMSHVDTKILSRTRRMWITRIDYSSPLISNLDNLVSLYVIETRGEGHDISLSNLRLLKLNCFAYDLLQYLKAPLLEEIFIYGEEKAFYKVLKDIQGCISLRRLTIDFELTPITLSRLLILFPHLNYLSLSVKSLEKSLEVLVDLLLAVEDDRTDDRQKRWSCCQSLLFINLSVMSPRRISDTKILDDFARRLFGERSKSSLKKIQVDWTDNSRWLLE